MESLYIITQTLAECRSYYGSYPRGENCYCTAFWGCYHQHFQVKPEIKGSAAFPSGLLVGKDMGTHDSDYYLEVSVTSKALLTTVLRKKVSVLLDFSPKLFFVLNSFTLINLNLFEYKGLLFIVNMPFVI